jgi:hypothetical protein
MQLFLTLLFTILLIGCKNKKSISIISEEHNPENIIDTMPTKNIILDTTSAEVYYDSLLNSPKDTSTLELKRKKLYNLFIVENKLSTPEFDTLIDLNYDGNMDYLIGYYGQSGTGIKNRVEAYIYNNKTKSYLIDEQLSSLMNPTFYISKKKITSFYLAHGGGDGIQLEWINNKWISTMEFSVDNEGENTKWNIYYPRNNKRKIITKPYQFVPTKDIFETNIHN